MKSIFYIRNIGISLILLLLCNSIVGQSKYSVKNVFDSLEVLKNVNGFVSSYSEPPTAEESRYFKIINILKELPYTDVKTMTADSNRFVRSYGFYILVVSYFDSITKSDLKIFTDSTNLPVYSRYGIQDVGLTVGEFCNSVYSFAIEAIEIRVVEDTVISFIKKFIKQNSLFPESYESVDFINFAWGDDNHEVFYEVEHIYKLKQRDGKEVEAKDTFVLDKNYSIVLIETNRTKALLVDPPRYDDWISRFGKTK